MQIKEEENLATLSPGWNLTCLRFLADPGKPSAALIIGNLPDKGLVP